MVKHGFTLNWNNDRFYRIYYWLRDRTKSTRDRYKLYHGLWCAWITGTPTLPRRAMVCANDFDGRRAAVLLEEEPEDRRWPPYTGTLRRANLFCCVPPIRRPCSRRSPRSSTSSSRRRRHRSRMSPTPAPRRRVRWWSRSLRSPPRISGRGWRSSRRVSRRA